MIRKNPSLITREYWDALSRQGRRGQVVLTGDVEVVQRKNRSVIQIIRKCLFCGKQMTLNLSRAKRGQLYCSRKCFFNKTPTQRFWEKVKRGKRNECWIWIGSKIPQGYGNGWWNGYQELAHRISWIIANGNIPRELDVLHRCDNPPCVNPRHLFLGTAKDNALDMVEKGRFRSGNLRGVQIGNSKLKDADILEIRRFYKTKEYTYTSLGRRYGVSYQQIANIISKKHWKHLP